MENPFIFLSYSRPDKETVDQVYIQLKESGLNPWMDIPPHPYELEGIPLGVQWDSMIRAKLRAAFRVLSFLSSKSFERPGYVHTEYRLALGLMAQRPVTQEWLIPVLLDDCQPPDLRVDTLSFDQLNWYRLHEEGVDRLIAYLKAAMPSGNHITAEHLVLIHSCWRAPKHDARFPHKMYRFDVIISATGEVLDRIARVTYLLPPAFPTSVITVSDRTSSFGLKELAWGNVTVRAKVFLLGEEVPIHLSTYVRLPESGDHLIPKGVS